MRERGALPSARFLPRFDIPTSQLPRVASVFHSSVSGLVHTGSGYILKVGYALRHRRRLELCSTTTATGPSRCLPPPCGTTGPPKSGAPPSFTSTVALLTPQVVPAPGLDCRPGLFQAFPSSSTAWSTLLRRVRPPGLSSGRWAATDGMVETAVDKLFPFLEEGGIAICHFDSSRGATVLSLNTPV